jgi:thioredoxin-dependent adenylylsulfate APS reductase
MAVAIDAARAASELEGSSADAILAWAAGAGGPASFSTGFGVEGCVLVHLIASARLPIDVFTLDTGLLFPETYALWQRLEQRYGITIHAVRPEQTVEAQAASVGPALWERDPDRCCDLRKMAPLKRALEGVDFWITAIRRDQTPERATAPVVERDVRYDLVKVNPLVRWTSKDIWRFVHANDVPYNPLHDQGYPSIGCQPCTSAVAEGEDPRAGRWRGREKRECGLHANPTGPINLTHRSDLTNTIDLIK